MTRMPKIGSTLFRYSIASSPNKNRLFAEVHTIAYQGKKHLRTLADEYHPTEYKARMHFAETLLKQAEFNEKWAEGIKREAELFRDLASIAKSYIHTL